MGKKATEDFLSELHAAVAEDLAKQIKEGSHVVDKETGEIIKIAASAALLGQAIKFLKDNHIECDPGNGDDAELSASLKDLKDVLYDGEAPTRVQ